MLRGTRSVCSAMYYSWGFVQVDGVPKQKEEFWPTIPSPVKSILIFANTEANGGGVKVFKIFLPSVLYSIQGNCSEM